MKRKLSLLMAAVLAIACLTAAALTVDVKTGKAAAGKEKVEVPADADKNAPDLDRVTSKMKKVSPEQSEEENKLTVKFVNESEILSEYSYDITESRPEITEEMVPETAAEEGKDFLGWYWGPYIDNTKYKGIFPLDLNTVPDEVFKALDHELIFRPRFGTNTPANPIEKDGYRLIFDDEFEGSKLDTTKWVDRYLSSWSTSATETNNWKFNGENVSIRIDQDTQPWCPEFDGQTVVSGFTTGQRNGLHNWNGTNEVRNPEDTQLSHINQYGYYEIRARGQDGSSRHTAWWLIGFQDNPDECMELDVFEVKGKSPHETVPAIHKWKDSDSMSSEWLQNYYNKDKDFNNEWHVYGFDWIEGGGADSYPDRMDLYVDGAKTSSINVNVDYPLIQIFSLYEKRAGGWTGNWEWMPYPNTFDLDYVRVYKPLPEGQEELPEEQLEVTAIDPVNLSLSDEYIRLDTYQKEDGQVYTEKQLPGTQSYVRVHWNDGIETQEAVVWDAITKEELAVLKAGGSITKSGSVPSVNGTAMLTIKSTQLLN